MRKKIKVIYTKNEVYVKMFVLLYCLISFATWTINPFTWGIVWRLILCIGTLILAIAIQIIVVIAENRSKNKS